jgi:hypothetical protein
VAANAWTNASYSTLSLPLVVYSVDIWSNTATQCTFDLYSNASLWSTLQASGYNALLIGGVAGVGGSAGYSLTCTSTTAMINAYVRFPVLDATVYALLVAGVDAGVVQFNSQTNVLTRISTVNYVPSTFTLSVQLPSTGIYLIAAVTENFVVDATVGAQAAVWVPAWANQTYAWSVKAQQDLWIQFMSNMQNTITVQPLTESQYNATETLTALRVWFNVNLATSSASHNSVIKYKYTDDQLTAVGLEAASASKLRLCWYDSAAAMWKVPSSGGSVDTNTKIVTQSTTSFSQWGVYYDKNKSASLRVQALSFAVIVLTVIGLLF